MLFENGFDDVVALSTGAEALVWLENTNPAFAIVDPRLADGLCSLVVRLLAEPHIPFIVYSGEDTLTQADPAFGAGEHLAQPALPKNMLAAVGRASKSIF